MAADMHVLRLIFSPYGRLLPPPFVLAAVVVYLAGAASQALSAPDISARYGLWPFALAQALLIRVWFVLHAKRLRDAGRGIGLAAGAALLYALSIVLTLILAVSFSGTLTAPAADANVASALGLILLLSIVMLLLGSSQYDLTSLVVAVLLVLAFVPVLVAVAVTLWAATRPSEEASKA
jgi:hypothetical protein